MGRWGSKLFQSDSDLDIVDFISNDAGVELLMYCDTEGPDARGIGQEATREKLNDGTLNRLFDKFKTKKANGSGFNNKYCMVILGALAMQVGARIRDEDILTLEHTYKDSGLQGKGLAQFDMALKDYKNDGTPLVFDSPGLMETMDRVSAGLEEQELGTTFFSMPNVAKENNSDSKPKPKDPNEGEFGDMFKTNLFNAMKNMGFPSASDTAKTSDKPKPSKKAKTSDNPKPNMKAKASDKTKENKPNKEADQGKPVIDEDWKRRIDAAMPNAIAYMNSQAVKFAGADDEK